MMSSKRVEGKELGKRAAKELGGVAPYYNTW
jgi:hypothetical protein